jgi:hypothetical protein
VRHVRVELDATELLTGFGGEGTNDLADFERHDCSLLRRRRPGLRSSICQPIVMSITFPRDLYDDRHVSCDFMTVRYEGTNQIERGLTQSIEMADRRWKAVYQTIQLSSDDLASWRAWLDSLDGSHFFFGRDIGRPYPKAYQSGFAGLAKAGGGDFDGTGITISALSASSISLADLPAGLVLAVGDYIGLEQSGKFGLYRIIEGVTADESGAAVVDVRPAVLTNIFTTEGVAVLAQPKCVMMLDPTSISAAEQSRSQSQVSFTGLQVLY